MVKSVRLSDNAYNNLKALKEEGESFSDVVKRLTAAEKKEQIEVFRALAAKATKRFEERGITREDIAEEIKIPTTASGGVLFTVVGIFILHWEIILAPRGAGY